MTVRRVSPAKCKMWALHVRAEDSISPASCASLIASIRRHGQRHPALARPRYSTEGTEYELIYGARRWFSAQQLGVDLLVDVRDIDDRAALIEMDIENRPREDISPYERGVNYGRWLRAGYFKNQLELAKELGVSEARVSRLLKYSQLPTVVVAAFDSVRDIREEWAVRLANKCRDAKLRIDIMRRARERAASSRKISPQCIFDALLRGVGEKVIKDSSRAEVIKGTNGKSLFRIAVHAKTLHVVLPRAEVSQAILDDITKAVAAALERRSPASGARRTSRKSEMARLGALSSSSGAI